MALQVTYRYKTQVTEESQRRLEGIKVKRKFPAKIPVSNYGLPLPVQGVVIYTSPVEAFSTGINNLDR